MILYNKRGQTLSENRPSVFSCTDYCQFLRSCYLWLKETDNKYSHRFIAREIGATSGGWFSDVLSGRITLSPRFIIPLCRLFQLSEKETAYFQLLIAMSQTQLPEEKQRILKEMLLCRELDVDTITTEHFEFYSKWYIPVIRELLFDIQCSDDWEMLARKLTPAITTKEAREAVEILIRCELVTYNEQGYLTPLQRILKKDSSTASVYWYIYMSSLLRLSQETLKTCPKNERDYSAITVMLSKEALSKAAEITKRYRRDLLSLGELDGDDKRAYQCCIQLFPVSI